MYKKGFVICYNAFFEMIVLNILGFCLLALTFFVAIKNYPKLPDRIPIYFNIEGEADRYGHRKWIFFTPVLSLIIFVLMAIIAFGDVGYKKLLKKILILKNTLGI